MDLSNTEENYLKSIFTLSYHNSKEDGVATNDIAKDIDISAASVSDMIKKMTNKGLLDYEKYQGVKLTKIGERLAINIIRKQRLWETFLVNKLNFKWDEVYEVAEQLEHIKSKLLISRLDEFLNFPKYDPHGDPIPDKDGIFHQAKGKCIQEFEIDDIVEVIAVKDNSPLFLQFLDKVFIGIGTQLVLTDKIPYDLSLEVKVKDNKVILSNSISSKLYVIQK